MATPKPNISFQDPQSKENVTMQVRFLDHEWELLMSYCDECQRIAESNLLKDFRVSFKISGEKGKPVKWESEIPDDDNIAVILHRVRPFILSKESTNFNKVCKLLKRRMSHPFLQSIIDFQRDEYSGRNFQAQSKIELDGALIVNANERLMDWVNSQEYHRDSGKKVHIDAINRALPNNFFKAVICSMLIDKVHAILAIGNLIVAMKLGEGKPILATSKTEVLRPK